MTKPVLLSLGIGAAGVVCAGLAARAPGPWAWLLAWTALACLVVAWAYAANRPEVFGKTAGRVHPAARLLLAPYLLAFGIACWILRRLRPMPAVDEVSPGVYVGGRVGEADVPPDAELVIDLIAEFPAPPGLRARPGYRGFPVLDGHHPGHRRMEAFLDLVEEASASPHPLLVHCESGVGRAPTATAVLLVARGLVPDPESAVELMTKRRPRILPTGSDQAFMRHALARLEQRRRRRGDR